MTPIALGLVLGLGLWLLWSWHLARRPRLEARIAPHVRASLADELRRRDTTVSPLPTVERLLAPVVRDGVRVMRRWGSSTADVEARLARAGMTITADQFRASQVVWALAGLAVGTAGAVVLGAARGTSPFALTIIALSCAVAGIVLRDLVLTQAIRRRESRILAELPTIAELLALSVAAGEGAHAALARVSSSTTGVLSASLTEALGYARTGVPLAQALTRMADGSGVPALTRFATGVATAVERGTPLADVLRAQAMDVRAEQRESLMVEGGRREILMMLPVVFVILPVTIVFAVYPGAAAINLGL